MPNQNPNEIDVVDLNLQIEKPALEGPERGQLIWAPYADWLVTSLALAAPSELAAELLPDATSVSWHLQRFDPADRRVIDTVKSLFFRPVLARIALDYMGGNPYGGYRYFHLRVKGALCRTAFYLANDGLNGFWFRGRCGRIFTDERPA